MGTIRTAETTERRHRLPLLQGVLPIDRSRVPADVIARMTLAALGILEVMGYTAIPGMPVITGLYTILILIPIAMFAVWDLQTHGVAVLGKVPSGLPSFVLPDFGWDDWGTILPTAASIFLVVLAQSAATPVKPTGVHTPSIASSRPDRIAATNS